MFVRTVSSPHLCVGFLFFALRPPSSVCLLLLLLLLLHLSPLTLAPFTLAPFTLKHLSRSDLSHSHLSHATNTGTSWVDGAFPGPVRTGASSLGKSLVDLARGRSPRVPARPLLARLVRLGAGQGVRRDGRCGFSRKPPLALLARGSSWAEGVRGWSPRVRTRSWAVLPLCFTVKV